MKTSERESLSRLYKIIDSVPLPIMGGAATGSISGFVGYANDMKVFVQKFKNCLLAFAFSGKSESLEDVLDMTMFSENIDDLEKWVETRKDNGWAKS